MNVKEQLQDAVSHIDAGNPSGARNLIQGVIDAIDSGSVVMTCPDQPIEPTSETGGSNG